MKVSAKDDPKIVIYSRVWVDGVEVSARCFEADDEDGYALCYIHDERTESEIAKGLSKFKLNEDRTELLTERLEGKVKIKSGQ